MRFRGAAFRTRDDGSCDGQLCCLQERHSCSNYGLIYGGFSGRQLSIYFHPTLRKEPHARTAYSRNALGDQSLTNEVSKMLQVCVKSTVHESTQTRAPLIPRWSSQPQVPAPAPKKGKSVGVVGGIDSLGHHSTDLSGCFAGSSIRRCAELGDCVEKRQ